MTFQCNNHYGIFNSNGINICFDNMILIPIFSILSISYLIITFEYPFKKQFQTEKIFTYLSIITCLCQLLEIISYKQHFCLIFLIISNSLLYYTLSQTSIFYIILLFLTSLLTSFHHQISHSLLHFILILLTSSKLCIVLIKKQKRKTTETFKGMIIYNINKITQWTYSYITPLLSLAKSRLITEEDLPQYPSMTFKMKETLNSTTFGKAILKVYLPRIFKIFPLFILNTLLRFVEPYMLKHILHNLEEGESIFSYALIIFIVPLIQAFLRQREIYLSTLLQHQIQKEVTSIIYEKMLKCRSVDGSKLLNIVNYSIGQITQFLMNFDDIVNLPLSIIISIVMMFKMIGDVTIWALLGMILSIPLTTFISRFQRNSFRKTMEKKEKRGKMTNEILTNIRQVKLEGLVPMAQERIEKCREDEQKQTRITSLVRSLMFAMNFISQELISIVVFALLMKKNQLKGSFVLPIMTILHQVRMPLSQLPQLFINWKEAKVGIDQITHFLQKKESSGYEIQLDSENAVEIKGTYGYKEEVILNDIDLSIQRGKLVIIVGEVASGKSTLLKSILGETILLSDKSSSWNRINGSVSYMPSTPWLRNCSVCDNILMGREYNEERMNHIIDICQLQQDILVFSDGLQTEIGERGITLSGGQKQRIGLARLLYQVNDIYLLDDILSAVDMNVANKIFEKVILDELKLSTRIICTHQLQFLQYADEIIILDNKHVKFHGSFEELNTTNYLSLLTEMNEKTSLPKQLKPNEKNFKNSNQKSNNSIYHLKEKEQHFNNEEMKENKINRKNQRKPPFNKPFSELSSDSFSQFSQKQHDQPIELMSKETIQIGRIKTNVLKEYFKKLGGIKTVIIYLFIAFSMKGMSTYADFILTSPHIVIWQYIFIKIIFIIGMVGKSIFEAIVITKTASRFHSEMLQKILHSPFIFFDTTPLGRILNRFTNDISFMDNRLKFVLTFVLRELLTIIFILIVNIISSPIFIPILVVLFFVYFSLMSFHIDSAQNLERLTSTLKSPTTSLVTEIIPGLHSIRSSQLNTLLIDEHDKSTNNHLRGSYASMLVDRWFCLRIDCIGSLIMFGSVLCSSISGAAISGLAITYAMRITHSLVTIIKSFSQIQTSFVSVERVMEYCSLETEEDIHENNLLHSTTSSDVTFDEDSKIHEIQIEGNEWLKGNISFENVTMRYRDELNDVLKSISFEIQSGEKIGICGRTGSGKTSLFQVLFRAVEKRDGNIKIDNICIEQIPHIQLRNNIGIIPQDPLVFEGSLRDNIDPYHKKTDNEIISF